ncbi:hypothetical protein ACFVS2_28190 [Brevibacillus sp. NPDC058079]
MTNQTPDQIQTINTKEGIDYTKYISLLYRFGEYTTEDVARFVG